MPNLTFRGIEISYHCKKEFKGGRYSSHIGKKIITLSDLPDEEFSELKKLILDLLYRAETQSAR